MSSNIMIELRQSDAVNVSRNGEYECILSRDITISEGDVIQMSKAFVDSVKEGDIIIGDDLTLTIQSGVYFTDWKQLFGNFINNEGETIPCAGATAEASSPSFKRFIPYLGVSDSALANYTNFLQFNFNFNYSGPSKPGFTFTFSYIDFTGSTVFFHTAFPPLAAGSYNKLFISTFNIVGLNDSFKLVSPSTSFLSSYGLTPIGVEGVPITLKNYLPFTFTTNIILPKGAYSPTQISTYISQQLSKSGLNQGSTYQQMNDTFFQFAVSDFDDGKANPNGQLSPNPPYLPVPLTEQTTFISDDGQFSYQFPAGDPRIIGTSQISLEYDNTADKFNFTYLHLPMLDATTGQNMSVRYLCRGLVQNGGIFGVTSHSGIYFQSLTAKDSSGRFFDFWSGLLGMDLGSLCVGVGSSVVGDALAPKYGLIGVINLSNPLIDGVNVTSGYYGLDSAIIRGTASNPNTWYSRQQVPYFFGSPPGVTVEEANDGINSTINSTNAIYASRTVDVLINKFSHYILQTDLGFNDNNFIGEKWYRNINGIIQKYFTYGSYTFSDTDGAIQYIHKGNDIFLKSIRVRLLKSNMEIDENLGNDNTIILQVIKAGTELPPVGRAIKD